MVKKIITWVDLQGRYRVTSPAYDHLFRAHGFDESVAITYTWSKLVASGGYGIDITHPQFLVEDVDQRVRLSECCGQYFRYAGRPDAQGRRDAIGGAWEMDVDGRPRVDMVKARLVQMNYIREVRDKELERLDDLQVRALGRADNADRATLEQEKQVLRDLPTTFDLSVYAEPEALKAAWPAELPARN